MSRSHRALALVTLVSIMAVPASAGPVQSRIYPAPTARLALAGLPGGTALIRVQTSDGLTLVGLAAPAKEGRPTLLVFHGNASSAADALLWLKPLLNAGYGVVAAEYRGYSGNPGAPGEAGLAADAEAFYSYARAQVGSGRVWVLGHSLGGAVAFGLARRHRLDALVTVGTFTRLRAMVPNAAKALVPNAYDNKAAVALLDEPYFLVHGLGDATVPSGQGEELHSAAGAARRPGASFVVVGADHRPKGEHILAILETVASVLASGAYPTASLPKEIKVVPFGQRTPINP